MTHYENTVSFVNSQATSFLASNMVDTDIGILFTIP